MVFFCYDCTFIIQISINNLLKFEFDFRGIDAPEHGMPYAEESKIKLKNLVVGKCLEILAYGTDSPTKEGLNRIVGDFYYEKKFIQVKY